MKRIREVLRAEVIHGKDRMNMRILTACGSDLLSDVLAFTKENSLLLTGLTNSQLIHTAEMVDIKAVCIVRGKKPGKECVEMAKNKDIPLLRTDLPMFEACGRLYQAGLRGASEARKAG